MKITKVFVPSVMKVYLGMFLVGAFVGFIAMYVMNYQKVEKSNELQEVVLFTNGNCYHIHHYITCGIILLNLIIGYKLQHKPMWLLSIIGVLFGIAAEDLLFKDWARIKNNCHKDQIITALTQSNM